MIRGELTKLTSNVLGKPRYLYRAVDSAGNTLDFLLAAKRFFRKTLKVIHISSPRVITVNKNAAYLKAFKSLKTAKVLPKECELRQCKCLNNIIEQGHQGIKRLVKPAMGFGSFNMAQQTIKGYEIMNMVRKGQIQGVAKSAVTNRVKFIAEFFGVATQLSPFPKSCLS